MSHRNVTAQTENAVEIDNVVKEFGSVTAVQNVSLSIRRGEFLTLLGPSGCGKTTLLNMIAGFEAPTSGKISFGGQDVTDVPPHQRDTGMVFQNYALFPHMSAFDNVAFGLRMRKLDKQTVAQKAERALEMVKLTGLGGRRIRQLSGGQQQRIALARAIAFGPRVLLLDEPLSALDKNLRTEMQFELKELHQKTGLTTIFVTHDQGEALSLSDRIVVMNRGEMQQISKPLDLYCRPANSFVASFIGEINRLPLARMKRQGNFVSFELPGAVALTADKQIAAALGDNESVHIFVRPEHIALVSDNASSPNRLPAKIVSHIYQGTHTVTRVLCEHLGQIEMRVPGGKIIDEKPAGSPVQIEFFLDQAVVLPDRASTK